MVKLSVTNSTAPHVPLLVKIYLLKGSQTSTVRKTGYKAVLVLTTEDFPEKKNNQVMKEKGNENLY